MTKSQLTTLILNSLLSKKDQQKWLDLLNKIPFISYPELAGIFEKETENKIKIESEGQKRTGEINKKYLEILKEFKHEKIKTAFRNVETKEFFQHQKAA